MLSALWESCTSIRASGRFERLYSCIDLADDADGVFLNFWVEFDLATGTVATHSETLGHRGLSRLHSSESGSGNLYCRTKDKVRSVVSTTVDSLVRTGTDSKVAVESHRI